MTNSKIKSDAVVLREFFGLLPGETVARFLEELRELNPAERKELADAVRAQA